MAEKQLALTETLSADRILTAAEFSNYGVWNVTPGAARNVDLPAASAALAGQRFRIRNAAQSAHTITLRLTSGGTTIATIDQNESCEVYCEGTDAPTFTATVFKVGAT